jgi:hypothetical protein
MAAAARMLAEAGGALLYNYGLGLGFLATVRPDGGPRPPISRREIVVIASVLPALRNAFPA